MLSIIVSVGYFIKDIVAFGFFGMKTGIQEILKEEKPEDGEHDKQLNEDDDPEPFANGHAPETIVIEEENPVKDVMFQSSLSGPCAFSADLCVTWCLNFTEFHNWITEVR